MPTKPKLLAGDNPQIPKGYGDEHIAAFLDAVPSTGPGGWKAAACRKIDAAVSKVVPGVQKAVKWNSPMYAAPDAETPDHMFMTFHCYDRYVKIGFFRGDDLEPPPPIDSRQGSVRYYHVGEGDEPGEQFETWIRQAAELPGVKM